MPHDPSLAGLTLSERRERARTDIRQALMVAFCNALRGAGLPPMGAMELAAEAIGSIYREVAAAHRGPGACPCGWQPQPEADLRALQAALRAALDAGPEPAAGPGDLARLVPVGRA